MEKTEKYRLLERQVAALLEGETDVIAKMANVAAVLHETFGFWWTGFYRVVPCHSGLDPESAELVLGPFQGPVACIHIPFGKASAARPGSGMRPSSSRTSSSSLDTSPAAAPPAARSSFPSMGTTALSPRCWTSTATASPLSTRKTASDWSVLSGSFDLELSLFQRIFATLSGD